MEAGREFGIRALRAGRRNTLRLEAKHGALRARDQRQDQCMGSGAGSLSAKWRRATLSGASALEQARAAGLKRTLVGLEMVDRGIARDGYRCCDEAGEPIGRVTSGSPSPTLGKEYRAGLCAALDAALGHGVLCRYSRAEVQGAGRSYTFLQASEESVTKRAQILQKDELQEVSELNGVSNGLTATRKNMSGSTLKGDIGTIGITDYAQHATWATSSSWSCRSVGHRD